eukprot:SAG11_NODE_4609_length_1836_cov_2.062752_1_plen_85_part_10
MAAHAPRPAAAQAADGAKGRHLSAREFHEAVRRATLKAGGGGGEAAPPRPQVLIDTRNHYGAAPNRRCPDTGPAARRAGAHLLPL